MLGELMAIGMSFEGSENVSKLIVVMETQVYVCTRLVTQSCLALCDPVDCSPPGCSDHGIFFPARILEWVAISSSRG